MYNCKEEHSYGEQIETPRQHKNPWWTWLAILLLPVTFLLPIWGEELQVKLIGYEGFCCMPDNWQELMQKADHAKSMRLESNLIIGTGILLAVILLVGIIFALYRCAIPCIKAKWLRRGASFIVGVLVAPFALFLLLAVIEFVFRNDEYHRTRYQPPRDVIYSYAIDFII